MKIYKDNKTSGTMQMKKLFLFFLLFTIPILSQNLVYETVTVDSLDDSIFVDLGLDLSLTIPNYQPTGDELRVIGMIFPASGTLTNDTLIVSGAVSASDTYYPVYDKDGNALLILPAYNRWIWLKPQEFAGLRYIQLSCSAAELVLRSIILVKRRY